MEPHGLHRRLRSLGIAQATRAAHGRAGRTVFRAAHIATQTALAAETAYVATIAAQAAETALEAELTELTAGGSSWSSAGHPGFGDRAGSSMGQSL